MKKNLFLLLIAICYVICTNAQEVHGVESKMVCTHNCNPNGSWDNWGRSNTPWFSFEFTNMNSIPVSVEVELYDTYGSTPQLISTKSFVLQKGESYIWKNSEANGVDEYKNHEYYFVKYKAYKLL